MIILMGLPGVGKTTTATSLFHQSTRVQLLDADSLWRINPFEVSTDNKTMVEANIKDVYRNFCHNPSLDTIIFTWVIGSLELFQHTKEWFDQTDNIYIQLTCSSVEYERRLVQDHRSLAHLDREAQLRSNYNQMDIYTIDTTNQSVEDIVCSIKDIVNQRAGS